MSSFLGNIAVGMAKVVLTLWAVLESIWEKLSPIRIRVNILWLKIAVALRPVWRLFEPLYASLAGTGKRMESALQVSRKGSAMFFGFLFILLIVILWAFTVPFEFFSVSAWIRSLIVLYITMLVLMSLGAMGQTLFNEFQKSQHLYRLITFLLMATIIPAFIPPMNPALILFILVISFFGLAVASIAGGCLDPDAFDYSTYMGDDHLRSEYKHSVADLEDRYKGSRDALERVAKKSKVEWEEEMEVMESRVDFEDGDLERAVSFDEEDEESEEFELAPERGGFGVGAVEFDSGEVDFTPGAVEFGEEENTFDRIEDNPIDEDFQIDDMSMDEVKKVEDFSEESVTKKEMPKEEWDF